MLRQLGDALERHRGDMRAWRRVGDQLSVQRRLLNAAYGNKAVFERERGINYRLIYDLESAAGKNPKRSGNFTIESILEAARAYGVEPLSFAVALDGGELVPGSGEPPPVPQEAGERPEAPGLVDRWLTDPALGGIAGYLAEIEDRILNLPAGTPVTGSALFPGPGEEWLAGRWDELASRPLPTGRYLTARGVAIAVAGAWAAMEQDARPDSASGLAAAGAGRGGGRPAPGRNGSVKISAGPWHARGTPAIR